MFKQYKERKVDFQASLNTPSFCISSHADAVDREIPALARDDTDAKTHATRALAREATTVRPSVRLGLEGFVKTAVVDRSDRKDGVTS